MDEPLKVPEICGCEESEYLNICLSSSIDALIKVTKGVESFLLAIDKMMVDMFEGLNYYNYTDTASARDAIQSDNSEMDNRNGGS